MRFVLKTKKGAIYRLTDPEACVTPDEWHRVCKLIEQLCDIAVKEKIDIDELLICAQEQLENL